MRFRVLWLLTLPMFAQTAVDLRTQSKNVDFSGAPSTKPMQTGTTLPSTCATGQMFFLTSAPAGSNLYGCESTNIWTLEGGGSGEAAARRQPINSPTGLRENVEHGCHLFVSQQRNGFR